MDYQAFVEKLSPDLVAQLRQGVETGRWPDGRPLTPQQREHSLQAIIAWESLHLPAEERVGFIDKGKDRDMGGRTGANAHGGEESLRWVGDSRSESS